MDEFIDIEPVRWMREMLGAWLGREDWRPEELIDWLQGYNLPPVGHDDEPFLWLLRGIPLADKRFEAETKLAERVGKVLEGKPDLMRPGTRPDKVLYNLFMLCAGLGCPDQLAEPLYKVFQRGVLKGEWLGVDVRDALQAALISNQIDNRLQPEWETMLEQRKHDFLPGDEYDGFNGIVMNPASAKTRGEPDLDAIGRALKFMAKYLDRDSGRCEEFQALIKQIAEIYPGRPILEIEILLQAVHNDWPRWAMQAIPGDYVSQILDPLKTSPYCSERAAKGIVSHGIATIEARPDVHSGVKLRIEKVHSQYLKEVLNVGAQVPGSA